MTCLLDDLCRPPADLTSRAADKLVAAITDPLAHLWLNDEILNKAKSYRRGRATTASLDAPTALPDDRGICILLLACESDVSGQLKMGALKSAIPFFVVWERSEDGRYDPRLPPDLRAVADRVFEKVNRELNDDERLKHMRLQLPHIWRDDFPDLSCLPFTFDSAFASLAAGLMVASAGGKANLKVMASACWDDEKGFQGVNGLAAKAKLAARLQCETLFVARDQHLPEDLKQSRPVIQQKLTNESNILKASSDFRKELFVRPEQEDGFEVCREYYVDILRGEDQAKEFYRETLLKDVADRCRDYLRNGCALPDYKYGITWVSRTPELVLLMEAIYKPEKLLLLHTGSDASIVRHATWLRDEVFPGRCEVIDMPDNERMVHEVSNALNSRLRTVDPSLVVVDLTPGFRFMTIALLNAVPKGCRLSVTQSDTCRRSNAALPLTERSVVWDKTAEPEKLIVRTARSMVEVEKSPPLESPSRLENEPTAGFLHLESDS